MPAFKDYGIGWQVKGKNIPNVSVRVLTKQFLVSDKKKILKKLYYQISDLI